MCVVGLIIIIPQIRTPLLLLFFLNLAGWFLVVLTHPHLHPLPFSVHIRGALVPSCRTCYSSKLFALCCHLCLYLPSIMGGHVLACLCVLPEEREKEQDWMKYGEHHLFFLSLPTYT